MPGSTDREIAMDQVAEPPEPHKIVHSPERYSSPALSLAADSMNSNESASGRQQQERRPTRRLTYD